MMQSITQCIEVAEQHACAWVMGATCGIRTGSIGQTKEYSDRFLKWKHISHLEGIGQRYLRTKHKFHRPAHLRIFEGKTSSWSCQQAIDHNGYLSQVRQESAAQPTTYHRLLVILLRHG
ncbi:hypothetical protein V8E51_003093 [Hyaloscypha variabilis]